MTIPAGAERMTLEDVRRWYADRAVAEAVVRNKRAGHEGEFAKTPGASVGRRWRAKVDKPRLELKTPLEGTRLVGGKALTKTQVHARVKQVAKAFADFYGDDEPPEVRREDEYLASVGSDARFRHHGEMVAGLLYGNRVARDAADPDLGVHPFRMVAHEAAHSLSGTRPGPLPGFSQTVEEGGAEVLSLWFWKHRGQEMDHRDATKVEGGWTEGTQTLVQSAAYRDWTAEVIRRSASKVGWDREAIVDTVEDAMRGDHGDRLKFRDSTRADEPLPEGVPDTPEGVIGWLLSDPEPALKGDWSASPAAQAEVRETIAGLLERYPIPFRHVEVADWVDEINQYAGKSNDTIHVSPKFLDDEAAAAREREWKGLSKAGEFGRPGTIVHEFGHIIDGHLLRNDRAASDEIDAFLQEPVPGVGGKPTPRLQLGLEAPSPYGAENKFEFVAEAFTDWYFNAEAAHPSSVAIGRIIDRALRAPVQEEWTLSRAALKAKAERQKRGPGGRWRHEGLRSAVGRRSQGWMDRDIANLRADVANTDREPSVDEFKAIGKRVDRVAKRFSRRHEMEAQMKTADDRRNELFDKAYAMAEADNWQMEDLTEIQRYLPPEEQAEDSRLRDEYFELGRKLTGADVHAYLGVLRELRPMGGEIRKGDVKVRAEEFSHDQLAGIEGQLDDALEEVAQVLPSAWLGSMNEQGEVHFDVSTLRAQHAREERMSFTGSGPEAYAARRVHEYLDSGRYEFAGYGKGRHGATVPVVRSKEDGRMTAFDGAIGFSFNASDYDTTLTPGAPPSLAEESKDSMVRINPAQRGTLLHELAHRVEWLHDDGRLLDSLLAFTEMRRDGAAYSPLSDLTGNEHFDDDERSFPDEWINPYVGKDYNQRASEVLTMGLQMLFYPTLRNDLASRDEDMRHYMLGLLAAA